MEVAKEEISMGLRLWKQAAGTKAAAHNIFYPENPKNKILDNGWHHWAGGQLRLSEATNNSCSEFTKTFSN